MSYYNRLVYKYVRDNYWHRITTINFCINPVKGLTSMSFWPFSWCNGFSPLHIKLFLVLQLISLVSLLHRKQQPLPETMPHFLSFWHWFLYLQVSLFYEMNKCSHDHPQGSTQYAEIELHSKISGRTQQFN